MFLIAAGIGEHSGILMERLETAQADAGMAFILLRKQIEQFLRHRHLIAPAGRSAVGHAVVVGMAEWADVLAHGFNRFSVWE